MEHATRLVVGYEDWGQNNISIVVLMQEQQALHIPPELVGESK